MPEGQVWKQVEEWLDLGFNVHPVYDKGPKLKTPVGSIRNGTNWGAFKDNRMLPQDLYLLMDESETNGLCVMTGTPSGGLEVADIDNKYKPGVEAFIFKSIESLFPELWAKIRIHKTTSGGFHLLWRISGHPVPKGRGIASRVATENELRVRPDRKEYCFIEMRGEGNLATLPPTAGYSVYKMNSIPALTWEERCAIIAIFESYNEVIKVEEPKYKPPANTYNNYSINPFDDFNANDEAEGLLVKEGWSVNDRASNNKIQYYTKPGSKSNSIHAYFNREKRVYAVFSTDTNLYSEKAQRPAGILGKINNWSGKELYQHLIGKGYGKMTHAQERRVVENVKKGKVKTIPQNLSKDAREEVVAARDEFAQAFPFGIFWEPGDKGGWAINLERIQRVSYDMGFRQSEQNLSVVQLQHPVIRKVSVNEYYDTLKSYIAIEDEQEYADIHSAYEKCLKTYGAYIIGRMKLLDEELLLKSTKSVGFKFFKNGWLEIGADYTILHPYDKLPKDKYFWSHSYLNREYREISQDQVEQSLYYQFIDETTGYSERVKQIIGYFVHDFKDPTDVYALLLTEDCDDPKKGGGTGKSTFTRLLSYATTFQEIPGENAQLNSKLYQSWKGQKVVTISDIPEDFEFTHFKSIVEGNILLKKLYKDEIEVRSTHTPKLIFTTNYSIASRDGGLDRRVIIQEYGDRIKRAGGIKKRFGKMFPDQNGNPGGWVEEDFLAYDNIIVSSIQAWLGVGELDNVPLSSGGWAKQFKQTFSDNVLCFLDEYFESWVSGVGEITNDKFQEDYNKYCTNEGIEKRFQTSRSKMHEAIEKYSEHKGYRYEHKEIRVHYERGRKFIKINNVGELPTTPVQIAPPLPSNELPF